MTTTERTAYMRGWATTAVAQGMSPRDAVQEAERAWAAHRQAEEAVMEELGRRDVNGRRRENRVVSCLHCGETLGIYVDGDATPSCIHICPDENHTATPGIWPDAAA